LTALAYGQRPAGAEPAGLLVLHHGRGSDERDLLDLADALDPARRLLAVTPRAALRLPGSAGYHWYVVPRVGHPDPVTFDAAYRALASFHERLWTSTGIPSARTVLGGFSMGSVMSYALGLGAGRPAPAAILAFSGFVPIVEGWKPSLGDRRGTRVFIAHGRQDPVIEVGFARRARTLLEAGGLGVDYHESNAGHYIDPSVLPVAARWLASAVPARSGGLPSAG
jgi:phospholipase/carboxylesterase